MEARLKIIEPTGEIISDIYHKIPFAKSDKRNYRNFLFLGDYIYLIKETGELVQVTNVVKATYEISPQRMVEIRALHQEKVEQINKQCL